MCFCLFMVNLPANPLCPEQILSLLLPSCQGSKYDRTALGVFEERLLEGCWHEWVYFYMKQCVRGFSMPGHTADHFVSLFYAAVNICFCLFFFWFSLAAPRF